MSTHARQYLSVNATSDGVNTLLAGTQNRQIRVLAIALTVTGTGAAELRQTNDTVLGRFGAGVHTFAGGDAAPLTESAQGQGLEINNPAGVDVVGAITYSVV